MLVATTTPLGLTESLGLALSLNMGTAFGKEIILKLATQVLLHVPRPRFTYGFYLPNYHSLPTREDRMLTSSNNQLAYNPHCASRPELQGGGGRFRPSVWETKS
jgi:hypothetical protein